jgi:hypothetical protein
MSLIYHKRIVKKGLTNFSFKIILQNLLFPYFAFSFFLDEKRNKKIKDNPIAPRVCPGQRSGNSQTQI